MKRGYRNTVRPTEGQAFEYRTLHSTGDTQIDEKRRDEMIANNWEWFGSEANNRAVGLDYHFRRARVPGRMR